jgi:hypothetical protein
MSKSITLQTSLSEVVANDVLGRISFAASNESSGSDAIRIGGSVTAVAESPFTEISNETSIYFSTASSEPAIPKLRISSKGHFAPLLNEVYDIGESGAKFRNLFVKNINADNIQSNSGVFEFLSSPGLIVSGIVLTNSVPSTTTNALYNDNGILKFNGSSVGVGGETNSNNIHPFLLGGM